MDEFKIEMMITIYSIVIGFSFSIFREEKIRPFSFCVGIASILLAIIGFGKYRLAPGYEHLKEYPKLWSSLSLQTQEAKIKYFMKFNPHPSREYENEKPSNAGKKDSKKRTKRRSKQEPELFKDRVEVQKPKSVVPPLKIKKKANNWQVCHPYTICNIGEHK